MGAPRLTFGGPGLPAGPPGLLVGPPGLLARPPGPLVGPPGRGWLYLALGAVAHCSLSIVHPPKISTCCGNSIRKMISASRRLLFVFYVSSHVKRPLFQCRLWPGYFLKLWLVASGLLSLSARGLISESGFQPGAIRSVRLSFFILIALSLFRVRFRVRFVFIPFLPLPYLTSPLFSFFLFVLKPN